MMIQPNFFEKGNAALEADAERLVLFALGDFQARGKELVERDLPFDRLRGALRRAALAFEMEELGDEQAASALTSLGARVRRVPTYIAKHPFRLLVPSSLAERARAFQKAEHGRER